MLKHHKILLSLAINTVLIAYGTAIALPHRLVNSPKKPAQVPNSTKFLNIQSAWKNLRLVYILNAQSATDKDILKKSDDYINGIYPVAISPDGSLLASAGLSEVRLFNLQTGKEQTSPLTVAQGTVPVGISSITFSPDGQLLSTGSSYYLEPKPKTGDFIFLPTSPVGFGDNIQLWNISNHTLLVNQPTQSPNTRISSLGQLVYEYINESALNNATNLSNTNSSSFPFQVVAFQVKNKETFSFPAVNTDVLPGQRFTTLSNDAILVITNGVILNNSNKWTGIDPIQFWDLNNGKLLGSDNSNSKGYLNIAVSPDGVLLGGLGEKNLLTLFNIQGLRAKLVSKIPLKNKRVTLNYQGKITFIAFTPDHQVLGTACDDKTVRLWDVSTGTLLKTISEHKNEVTSLAFSSDNKTLVTSDRDGKIIIWRND